MVPRLALTICFASRTGALTLASTNSPHGSLWPLYRRMKSAA